MENKYFTPDIEDIRVGYECEIWWCCGEPREWVKTIATLEDEEEYAKLTVSDIALRIGHGDVRVPYLTKEQIEAEGWIKAKAPIVTIKHDFYEIPYIKDNFRVDYNFRNNLINIIENNGENLFYGKCKDINTFRKIIKLLGI